MQLSRTLRLSLAAAALGTCAALLVASNNTGQHSAPDNSRVIEPQALQAQAANRHSQRPPARNSEAITVTTTTTAPIATPVSTTVPATAPALQASPPPARQTTPSTTVPPATTSTTAPPPAAGGLSYSYSFTGSPQAACDAELTKLRGQGYTTGSFVACTMGLAGSYFANVSDGTHSGQIVAAGSGTITVATY